jgi:uncharacterized protein (TIGR00369 family)
MLSIAERIIAGEIDPPPVAKLIGFNLRSVERGRAVLDLEAGPQHWNPMGGLHGGILCDLTDAAMGIAYSSTLEEGEAFATVELKINFLRPVKQGLLIAEGRVVSGGRTLGYTEAEVRDEDGRLIAKASSTCKTLRPSQPVAS